MSDLVDEIEQSTGYRFTNLALLTTALTHRSFAHEHDGAPHNERLEFIGDSVLGLCMTRLLDEAFPEGQEDLLTRLRHRLVETKAFGRVGFHKGLHNWLRLGRSEADKPRPETRIVGSAVEALFGAIFTEGGFDAALNATRLWFQPEIDALKRESKGGTDMRHPIAKLQELTQGRWKVAPTYFYLPTEGPSHAPTYHVQVLVKGEKLAVGHGPSKPAARRQAARLAYAILSQRLEESP